MNIAQYECNVQSVKLLQGTIHPAVVYIGCHSKFQVYLLFATGNFHIATGNSRGTYYLRVQKMGYSLKSLY